MTKLIHTYIKITRFICNFQESIYTLQNIWENLQFLFIWPVDLYSRLVLGGKKQDFNRPLLNTMLTHLGEKTQPHLPARVLYKLH